MAVDCRQIWSMDKSWRCVTLSGFLHSHIVRCRWNPISCGTHYSGPGLSENDLAVTTDVCEDQNREVGCQCKWLTGKIHLRSDVDVLMRTLNPTVFFLHWRLITVSQQMVVVVLMACVLTISTCSSSSSSSICSSISRIVLERLYSQRCVCVCCGMLNFAWPKVQTLLRVSFQFFKWCWVDGLLLYMHNYAACCSGAKIFGSALLQPARSVCVCLSAFSFVKWK